MHNTANKSIITNIKAGSFDSSYPNIFNFIDILKILNSNFLIKHFLTMHNFTDTLLLIVNNIFFNY